MNLSWRNKAACHGLAPTIFFPAEEEDTSPAKEICGECPVQEPCLEHAITLREKDGIWGGYTERERRRLVRQRRRTA